MKAEQLRIGNWVIGRHCGFTKEVQVFELNSQEIRHTDNKQNPIGILSCDPIPLTADWLQKFGFSTKDYKPGYIGIDVRSDSGMIIDFVLTNPHFMGPWQNSYAFDLSANRFIEVEYVHQLQNLFFAINGVELRLVQP